MQHALAWVAALLIVWAHDTQAQDICSVVESAKIVASNGQPQDQFGIDIDVDGDTAVVGAMVGGPDEPSPVYVLTRTNGGWVESATLVPSSSTWYDSYGQQVAIDGDTIFVTAPDYHVSSPFFSSPFGAVFVFTCVDGEWIETDMLQCTTVCQGVKFGTCVAIEGDRAFVGTIGEYVFVFTRVNGQWIQTDLLAAPGVPEVRAFGTTLAIANDTLIVGARGDDFNGVNAGAVFLFERNGAEWEWSATLRASDGSAGDSFGSRIAIHENRIAVGAVYADGANGTDVGAAYVFEWNGESWVESQKLAAADADQLDSFGVVLFAGDRLVVGASRDSEFALFAGAMYVFERTGEQWHQVAKLHASDAGYDDLLTPMAFDGHHVVAGSSSNSNENGAYAGAVYLFNLDCEFQGDLNADGFINQTDRALFCDLLNTSAGDRAFNPDADLNSDGVIDHLDLAIFNTVLPTCLGDVVTSDSFMPPGDDVVNGADLAYLLGAWGNAPSCADLVTSATFAPPPDGLVNGADLAALLGAWGPCD